jgi:hypothetical protein
MKRATWLGRQCELVSDCHDAELDTQSWSIFIGKHTLYYIEFHCSECEEVCNPKVKQ